MTSYEVHIYGEDSSIEMRYDSLDSVEKLIEMVMATDDKYAPDVKVVRDSDAGRDGYIGEGE
jgi:hypothetical protein